MFGPRLSSLFANRWMALLWAAGICWFAIDFTASDEPEDANAAAAEQRAAAEALGYNQAELANMQDKLRNW
jgi:Holliday junction resolvasome RuvABC DNA-binding subunit